MRRAPTPILPAHSNRVLRLLCWCVLALAHTCFAAPTIAIVNATLIHPEREFVERERTLIIEGNRIVSIGATETLPPPADALIIDARGKWLLPGLIDAHVHFFQSGNFFTRPDIANFERYVSFAEETARNKARLPATFKVWLANGVTGVVDAGGPMWNFDVRAAARVSPAAPRVAVAGPLVSMIEAQRLNLGDPPIIRVDSPQAARELVEHEAQFKPDYIKVWFIHNQGDDLAEQEAIVAAAGAAAHAAGIRLAVHATELAVAKAALRAGADFLVHSVENEAIDDEFIALALRRKVLYCPTLSVYYGYQHALSGEWQPSPVEAQRGDPEIVRALSNPTSLPSQLFPHQVSKLILHHYLPRRAPIMAANLRKAHAAGITVVMGTDAGNIGTLHGPSIHREMAMMAQAGLTPMQIIQAATVSGARALGRENELGTLSEGKLADVIILNADPLQDIANLSALHRVIKDGVVFDPDELIRAVTTGGD
jgi:imidazolonepropionase-like amidohydrolase